jgi:hypothetical protein
VNLLIKLLPYAAPALRYYDDPNRSYWRVHLLLFTLVVYALDVVVAHLFFAPKRGEWTVSHVLERTISTSPESLCLARAIDVISPGHIKNLSR